MIERLIALELRTNALQQALATAQAAIAAMQQQQWQEGANQGGASGNVKVCVVDADISAMSAGGVPGQGTGTLCLFDGTTFNPTSGSGLVTYQLLWKFIDKGVKGGAFVAVEPYGDKWLIFDVDSCSSLF